MKKTLLLLTSILTITACQSAQNPNANNAAGNQNANQIGAAADEPSCESNNDNQVVREIVIEHADASGARIRRPVDDINIGVGNKKVVWCINNQSGIPISVLINDVRVKTHPDEKDPFGDGSWRDNTFVSKLVQNNRVKNVKTKVAYKFGTYEYDILVSDRDGNPLDFEDPQVVISEGLPTVKSGNSNASLKNANAGNSKNK